MKPSGANKHKRNFVPRCYGCRKEGHFARLCPTLYCTHCKIKGHSLDKCKKNGDSIKLYVNMSTNVLASDHRSANPNADLRNVNDVDSSLLNPRSNCAIGTWNVQTMCGTSRAAQMVKEMGNYQLDMLGMGECRWTGSGKMNTIGV